MKNAAAQHKKVPNSVVVGQCPPTIKNDPGGVEDTPYQQK